MKPRHVAALAALLVLTPLAACGGDDDDAATAQPPAAAPSEPTTDDTTPSAGELTVMVTNDDGVSAPGIDALVEALSLREGIEVVVVAPADDRTGTGGRTTPGELVTTEATTASGYPAVAVEGYPADTVVWAFGEGAVEADLVVSGINAGQNIGTLTALSGTVGAARQAAQLGVPSVAVSQGAGEPPDYPSAVQALLDWLDANEAALADGSLTADQVTNINVPTCADSQVQGTVEVPLATATGLDMTKVDCNGSATPTDDVSAFVNGWISLTPLEPTGSVTE